MIERLRNDEVGSAPWVRTLRLAVLALVQTLPIAFGSWIVGAALGWGPSGTKPNIGHVLAGVALMVSGVLIIHATYRDWRYGAPYNRSRALLAGLALLVLAPVALIVLGR